MGTTMASPAEELLALVRRDPRYPLEAYQFVLEGLPMAQMLCGKRPVEGEAPGVTHHITGRQLVMGLCVHAQAEFGYLARTVFRQWGIQRTQDVGHITFNLIQARILAKSDTDSLDDFADCVDLDAVLVDHFSIQLPAQPAGRGG
jgi:uncharacterized repeat protein (TIGR04138 family)